MGGWAHGTLVDLGGGQYDADGPGGVTYWFPNANGGNAVPYADLELYLMGLLPAASVTNPIVIAEGFQWTVFNQGKFSATNLKTMTMADIIAGDGARVPAYGAAPTNFRGIVVCISTGPLSGASWKSLDADVSWFSTIGSDGDPQLYNFWEATQGRGRMQMDGLLNVLRPGREYVGVRETQTLNVTMFRGDPPPLSNVVYTLTNSFAAPQTWTADVSAAWLIASPAGGTLAPGASTQVNVSIAGSASNTAAGLYAGSVSFANVSNAGATVRYANLNIHDFAELPFFDGFESGSLSPYWTASGTGEWRIVVSATNTTPHSGSYQLCLDDYLGGGGLYFSRNEATLGLDLDGYTNVVLTFWVYDAGEEPHGPPPSPFIGAPTSMA